MESSATAGASPCPRLIGMVAFDGVQIQDVSGPLKVSVTANEPVAKTSGPQPYTVRIVARPAHEVTASAGIMLATRRPMDASRYDLRD